MIIGCQPAVTEQNASKPKPIMSRGCLVSLVVSMAFVGLLVIGIPFQREKQRLSFERQKAEWRQDAVERVKRGDQYALIMDSKLLPMLANDADCVANLNALSFSMMQMTDEDARFVSQLSNVETLSFYDTRGADLVLENARNLPIMQMGFDMSRLPKDSLRTLSESPDLSTLHFGHVMYPSEIAILKTLQPRITVHIPYPAEKEPWFIERGKPSDPPALR